MAQLHRELEDLATALRNLQAHQSDQQYVFYRIQAIAADLDDLSRKVKKLESDAR